MGEFSLTPKQDEANKMLGQGALHNMLFGGSRSGKTFLLCRAVLVRALKAPGSRHAILRFRFNHIKNTVGMDTMPKVFKLCFPNVKYKLDKTDWYFKLPNGSEIWLGGLDDKERTEKILGAEFATIYLNECSQISWNSVNIVRTRLAQKVDGLSLRMYYDCNPPSKAHWTYKLFIDSKSPDSNQKVNNPEDYASLLMNPEHNAVNLPSEYIRELKNLPEKQRQRFLLGMFGSITDNALWSLETIDKYRINDLSLLPDYQRVIVAVDPSGTKGEEDERTDSVGIVVAALGSDGEAYVLEDVTTDQGPAGWGKVVASAFERHGADCVIAENNFGGAMVEHVIQSARPGTPYKAVVASRGKVVRAEPVAALYEQGKVHHVGHFADLEDQLLSFTTVGWEGEKSPDRGDALVWALTEIFPGVARKPRVPVVHEGAGSYSPHAW